MRGWLQVLTSVVFVVMSAATARAQLTVCSVAGEFVLAGTLISVGVSSQLGGVFVFTPPNTCSAADVGSVTIAVTVAAPGGGVQPINAALPYTLAADRISIAGGTLVAGAAGVANNVVTSMALNGDGGLIVTGTLMKRGVAPLAGPPGPQGPQGPQGLQGLQGAQGPPGPAGTAALGAYGSFSNDSGSAFNVTIGGVTMPFFDSSPLTGLTHVSGQGLVTVVSAGTYRLGYCIRTTANTSASTRLVINGSAVNASIITPVAQQSTFCRSLVFGMPAGSTVFLQLFGTLAPVTLISPGGAELVIERLGS